jgi:hypothetical protein
MSRKPKVKAKKLSESSPLKYYDLETETWAIHNQGAIVPIMAPSQGEDDYQRIGRKTVTRSIFIRGKLELYYVAQKDLPGGGDVFFPSTLNRLMLVIDWQSNGQLPTINDILAEPYPEAQLNMDNRKRFTIIKDEVIPLDPVYITRVGNKSAIWGQTMVPIKWYEKVHIETLYNNLVHNDQRSIVSGAIYLVLLGNAIYTLVNNYNQVVVSTRCRFYDENAGTE